MRKINETGIISLVIVSLILLTGILMSASEKKRTITTDEFTIIEIDGCEYIELPTYRSADFNMIHKGNCINHPGFQTN